ncbi:MAG TPA: DegQ family serine endoprotease [Vicinamibacterales bacterium]|nr:DegQ family serine endoprotease [Vicinamibacterales bacterium]
MFNLSPRHLLTRAGTGAAVVALVAVTGYSVGQTQAARATAAAAPVSTTTSAAPVAAPGLTTSYADVVRSAAPAVVTVRVDKRASMVPTQAPDFMDDPTFREFFGRRFQMPRQQRAPRQAGLGSGVIATPDGYILTNNHVIDGADHVRVELTDRRTFDAKVVGADAASDLALLKIDASNLKTLPIGDSSRVNVGDVVLAIGNPLGVGQTVTMGIISAKGRATGVGDGSYEDFLQTDAPINQGNSGGALVSATGELVGINSQILTPTGGNIGLGFAIPSNMARQVMDQLRTDGKVVRGRLGVTIQNVTADIASSLKLSDVGGALVNKVEPGGPADRAGIKQGDVIVGVDGEKIADNNALRNRIASMRPGSKVAIDVLRDGRPQTLHATVDTLTPEATERAARGGNPESGGFGMTVEPLTPEIARSLQLSRRTDGVVVSDVDPDGAAAAAGLQEGDVIAKVNGQAVKTPAELKSALDQAGDRPALLLVARQNAEIFVTIKREK